MVNIDGVVDFRGLLVRLAQDEIKGYYDTLKRIADNKEMPPPSRVSAIKEMRVILEKYCLASDVEIPKFIEVGARKYKMMEQVHKDTVKAAKRIAAGDVIEDIVDMDLGFGDGGLPVGGNGGEGQDDD